MSEHRTLEIDPHTTSTAHRLRHYDGVCGSIHGHNIRWDIRLTITMQGVGDDNMPVDFKWITDMLDECDHATLLNMDDPMVDELFKYTPTRDQAMRLVEDLLGDVIWFDGDPTCEMLSQWMADRLVDEIERVREAHVTVHETSKYSMKAQSFGEY